MRRINLIKSMGVGIFLFSTVPLMAIIAVLGDMSYENLASPGQTYSGAIVLRNSGNEPEEAKIYQTDYLFYSDGKNDFGEPGSVARSNSAWIEFSPKRITVPPKEDMPVYFTVHVPERDSLYGSYWSVLMIEQIPRTSPESIRSEKKMGVTQVIRYAAQIVTNIGEGIRPKIRFTGTQLVQEKPERIFFVDLVNEGVSMVRPPLTLKIVDSMGVDKGIFNSERRRMFPGTSVRHRFNLTELPKGTYKALIIADCGGDDVFGIQYTIKIDE